MHYTKPFTMSRNISYFVYLFIYQLFCLSYLFVVIGYVIAIYVYRCLCSHVVNLLLFIYCFFFSVVVNSQINVSFSPAPIWLSLSLLNLQYYSTYQKIICLNKLFFLTMVLYFAIICVLYIKKIVSLCYNQLQIKLLNV
jgi:hypothetical protein